MSAAATTYTLTPQAVGVKDQAVYILVEGRPLLQPHTHTQHTRCVPEGRSMRTVRCTSEGRVDAAWLGTGRTGLLGLCLGLNQCRRGGPGQAGGSHQR